MTEKEQLLGDLFRNSLYRAETSPEFLEMFSNAISKNFKSEDFLILQLASRLYESAQIRKKAEKYAEMGIIVRDSAFEFIEANYKKLGFSVSFRFKSVISEIYKRCERIFDDGRSPEIKDIIASSVIIFRPETQETLRIEYEIAKGIIENFSVLNSSADFPLYVNLTIPDKVVAKSDFSSEEHPTILLPNEDVIIPELTVLGKDYISHPKKDGYQAHHTSYELISKENPSLRISSEIQVKTIKQKNFIPFCHFIYKQKRNERWNKVFKFDESKVGIVGYYPEYNTDSSGFSAPIYVTEKPRTTF